MKKLILSLACFAGIGFSASAQDALEVSIDEDLCISSFTIAFSDGSQAAYELGCGGNYSFETGDIVADYIIVNGIECFPESITEVVVNNNKVARVGYKKNKVTFGGGTTRID